MASRWTETPERDLATDPSSLKAHSIRAAFPRLPWWAAVALALTVRLPPVGAGQGLIGTAAWSGPKAPGQWGREAAAATEQGMWLLVTGWHVALDTTEYRHQYAMWMAIPEG